MTDPLSPKSPVELFGVECGPGWRCLVEPLIARCRAEGVTILQIKEKFGTLRFYVAGADDTLYAVINAAEEFSATLCEECGKFGKLRQGGWWRTLCDQHAKEAGYE